MYYSVTNKAIVVYFISVKYSSLILTRSCTEGYGELGVL
jgi:hypothetical protein